MQVYITEPHAQSTIDHDFFTGDQIDTLHPKIIQQIAHLVDPSHCVVKNQHMYITLDPTFWHHLQTLVDQMVNQYQLNLPQPPQLGDQNPDLKAIALQVHRLIQIIHQKAITHGDLNFAIINFINQITTNWHHTVLIVVP